MILHQKWIVESQAHRKRPTFLYCVKIVMVNENQFRRVSYHLTHAVSDRQFSETPNGNGLWCKKRQFTVPLQVQTAIAPPECVGKWKINCAPVVGTCWRSDILEVTSILSYGFELRRVFWKTFINYMNVYREITNCAAIDDCTEFERPEQDSITLYR